ncbi:MAG: hypothetical protein GVY18_12950, partial [Bacteroidetes bacterium]|nr:hypothetical protein [Bacteroidota bacterium]
LRYGDFHTLQADEAVYAYVRSSPTERVLVVLNKSETPKTVTLTLPDAYSATLTQAADLLSDQTTPIEAGQVTLEVSPVGWRVLSLE